jgi:Zn-dependent peptidase ImmA (M78 family)
MVDLSQSAVSRIESGERAVDSLELARIASVLNTSVLDLLETRPLGEELRLAARTDGVPESAALDRALSRVTDLVDLEHVIADAGWVRGAMPQPPTYRPRAGDPMGQGKRLAERIREEWGLDDDPLPINGESLIEELSGLDIALEPLDQQISGLYARVDDFAIALVDSSATAGRQRFTMLHELCHFLMEDTDRLLVDKHLAGRRSHHERRANAFAAHFLMPEKSIRRYVRRRDADPEVIVDLQYIFGVSLEALLYHLLNLDLISDYRRQQLLAVGSKDLSFRFGYEADWARRETRRGLRRPPRSLRDRALKAYGEGLIGIEPLARLMGRADPDGLRRELDDQGIGEERWWEAAAPA